MNVALYTVFPEEPVGHTNPMVVFLRGHKSGGFPFEQAAHSHVSYRWLSADKVENASIFCTQEFTSK